MGKQCQSLCTVGWEWCEGKQRTHLNVNLHPAKKTQSETCQMNVPCICLRGSTRKMVTNSAQHIIIVYFYAYANCVINWRGFTFEGQVAHFNKLGLQQTTGDAQSLISNIKIWKVLKTTFFKEFVAISFGTRSWPELKCGYL